MKILRITLVFALFGILFASCAKEEAPIENTSDDPRIELAMELVHTYNITAEKPIDLTPADIKAAIFEEEEGGEAAPPCDTGVGCCYGAFDFSQFMINFGCTSGCPVEWDLNCDGVINTADLLIFLTRYPCPPVDADFVTMANANGIIYVQSALDGKVKNMTLIDGIHWYSSPIDIDAVTWYLNGVAVSNDIASAQIQYPGASPSDYDMAIPCNGYYEIAIEVTTQCKTYYYSECFGIKLLGNPTCATSYCSL